MFSSSDSAAAITNSCWSQSKYAIALPGAGFIRPRIHLAGPNTNRLARGVHRLDLLPKGESSVRFRPSSPTARSFNLILLKVERSYKQLVEIVQQGDEAEVMEQVLRALGGLGDASAVKAIEKRLKGSMFSKPPTGVRIAGLSALAAIGTPHAMSLVEKAKSDKNPEVSSAVGQLLAGR